MFCKRWLLAVSGTCTLAGPGPPALCVFTHSPRTFSGSGRCRFCPPSESCWRVVLLHSDSSPRCRLQRLPIDSLMASLRAAAPFPPLTAGPTPFNVKAASNAFLPLFSNYRLRVPCMKCQIKDVNNLPKASVSAFDWPTVTCSVILLL